MKRIQIPLLLLLTGLFLITAGGASAAPKCDDGQTNGDGNSGLDQYAETIPGSCDDKSLGGGNGSNGSGGGSSNGSGGGGSSGESAVLSPETAAELESLGADGQAAAALANATAPAGGNGGGEGASGDGRGEAAAGAPQTLETLETDDSSGLDAVIGALLGDSDEGIGWALPLIMLASLITVVAVAVRRRRG